MREGAVRARFVADGWALDLDDVGAEISQEFCAPRAGDAGCEVEDAEMCERSRHRDMERSRGDRRGVCMVVAVQRPCSDILTPRLAMTRAATRGRPYAYR